MKVPSTTLTDRRMATAYAVLLLGLVATAYVFHLERKNIELRALDRFTEALRANRDTLTSALVRYVDVVRSANSFFRNNPTADPKNWTEFMQNQEWRLRIPGFRDIGYAEVFNVNGRLSMPIRFVATTLTNSPHVIGFDMALEPLPRDAALKAADSGAPVSTAQTNLFLLSRETNSEAILFVPRYEEEMANPTVELRRKALRGFAFATFNSIDLWKDLAAKTDHTPIAVALMGTPEADALLNLGQKFRRTPTFQTWGQSWKLICVARSSLIEPASQHAPQTILAGGLAISLFAFVLVGSQVRRRIRAEVTEAETQRVNRDLERRIAARTSDLSRANSQLQQSLSKEKELGEMKSSFVSTVSHEFRTPLGIIVSSAGILERYLDRLTPDQRTEHLRTVQQSAERMTELMEGVLLFSKVEAGAVEFDAQPIDLLKLCHRVVDEVKSSTNCRCPIQFSNEGSWSEARSDEKLLRVILTNILNNAVKYSPAGAMVQFQICRVDDRARFTIRDSGIGITAVDLPRLGVPFQRGQNVGNHSGTGLGLALVKKCVDIHGGNLTIESKEGVGTVITVTLPLFGGGRSKTTL